MLYKIKKNQNQKGSFILELMIGLFMSLITILGVMTIYAQFEGQKRTTSQAGQTVGNAALALFPIQEFGKMAGFGFNSKTNLGCTVDAYNETTSKDYTFLLSPIVINAGADNSSPDSITFLFGDSDNFFSLAKTSQAMSSATDTIYVDNRFGFRIGDTIILANGAQNCTMRQITDLPTALGTTNQIIHLSGANYTDPYSGTNKNTTYNKPGGNLTYGTATKIFNLGSSPNLITFSIVNNQLQQNNTITGNNDISIIGDNIVSLKAFYGLDTNLDGTVDSWVNVIPGGDPNIYSKIIGLRVAILARSALKEKAENGVCNVTLNSNVQWQNGTFDISKIPDWGCYRYRVLQTTVPLRNMMWGAA